MPRIPVIGPRVRPEDGAERAPNGGSQGILARSRYNRDVAFALSALPRAAKLERDLMTRLESRAQPEADGLADGFVSAFDVGLSKLFDQAPTPEARTLTENLSAGIRRRADERALATEASARTDFFRTSLEGSINATRERIAGDPDGAEDSFNDLIGALSLAADGWLGHETGEGVARTLEGELFEDAALRLIERDPDDAAKRLGEGLFGTRLADETRARLITGARERATARAEDVALQETRAQRARLIEQQADRARARSELFTAAGRGTATRDAIATAFSAGRLDGTARDEILGELTRAEDAATLRAGAIGRIDDFLGTTPANIVARRPLPETGQSYPGMRPNANDMNAWWEDIFLPSTQGLPDEDRVPAEDRMIRRLGLVPAVILTAARGLLYSDDPSEVAKGALRLASLTEDLPAGAVTLNPREAGAVRAVSDAAKELPTPELAVARAGQELGGPGGTLRDALLRPGDDPVQVQLKSARDKAPAPDGGDGGDTGDGGAAPDGGKNGADAPKKPGDAGGNIEPLDESEDEQNEIRDELATETHEVAVLVKEILKGQVEPKDPDNSDASKKENRTLPYEKGQKTRRTFIKWGRLIGKTKEDVPNAVLEMTAEKLGFDPQKAILARDIVGGDGNPAEIRQRIEAMHKADKISKLERADYIAALENGKNKSIRQAVLAFDGGRALPDAGKGQKIDAFSLIPMFGGLSSASRKILQQIGIDVFLGGIEETTRE